MEKIFTFKKSFFTLLITLFFGSAVFSQTTATLIYNNPSAQNGEIFLTYQVNLTQGETFYDAYLKYDYNGALSIQVDTTNNTFSIVFVNKSVLPNPVGVQYGIITDNGVTESPAQAYPSSVLSTGEVNNDTKMLTIYPNPSNAGYVFVKLKNANIDTKVEIVDATGKLVINNKFERNSDTLKINHHLSPGIYLVKVTTGKDVSVSKLIVK